MNWFKTSGTDADIVVSSRVRLARNLKAAKFPTYLDNEEQEAINERVKTRFFGTNTAIKDEYLDVKLNEMSDIDRAVLMEKRLISQEAASSTKPVEVLIRKDEEVSILLGEEDHIRIQALQAGKNIEKAYLEAERIAILLEQNLEIAYDENYGFLSSCPSNTGTGMRASLMLHLPALTEQNKINILSKELTRLGLTLRGAMGEGSEGRACLYQVSNQITLGLSEESLLKDLLAACEQIISAERKASEEIRNSRKLEFEDQMYRNRGILEYARSISQREAEMRLSSLRWGIASGLFKDLDIGQVSIILAKIGKASIERAASSYLSPEQRDTKRAKIIRKTLQRKDVII